MNKIPPVTGNSLPAEKKKKISHSDDFKTMMDQKTSPPKTENKISTGPEKAELPPEARSALAETPDVRADKVESIKKQIADGTYKIDARDVAGAMLRKGFKP
ncbi:MAG: flagellar biosynthesis anti-sigma factor FlgM [Candidatus Wallbacteria bacterium]|nr:flagellar biosynthesis anti-sigma factor FlgM [Candidatus Wallbacteria bacterium]